MKTKARNFSNPLEGAWYQYKLFVDRAITGMPVYQTKDISYWQERLFVNLIVFSLPLSLLAVVPSMIAAYLQGHLFIPLMDGLAVTSISFITLSNRFKLAFKKAFVAVVLYAVAICLTTILGSFGIGAIYFLALSVYITLQFSSRIAYRTIAVNACLYISFACIIYFKLFNSPLSVKYTLPFWIVYALNFMFLNVAVVVQISHIIRGVKKTFIQEARLMNELQTEMAEKIQRNEVLKESEAHYKSLFQQNPSPMWIFDTETLQLLQVNDAAIRRYGYSREEFLSMSIKELRPEEKLNDLTAFLDRSSKRKTISLVNTVHRHKNGDLFYAEVRCSNIPFKGKKARLVMARNITAQLEYTQAIEKQNAKLREISHMQSHVVRAPLARILGLTDLVLQSSQDHPDKQLFEYLDISVKELDDVIKTIIQNSEEVIPEKKDDEYLRLESK
ncbi:PAS domain S-box protein [Mucilaginibacter sp. PAMB04274]|uniref:PAS domain S-box protein n=1 Tax=Mucilaginibacter sp. PAMB04274 TaxID=3138568 RepID=UPI0031F6AAD5